MGASLNFRTIPGLFASHLRRDAALYLIVLLYTIAGFLYAYDNGISGVEVLETYREPWTINFGITYPVIALICSCCYIFHRLDSRRRLAFRQMLDANRLSRFLAGEVLLFALIFFQSTFTAVKIATVQPAGFQYDRLFAEIDVALHFGYTPFELLYRMIGSDTVRHVLEINYDVFWFVICYGVFFWMATSVKSNRVRLHYMLSVLGAWIIIGNIVAGLFPSAGPAFFGLVTGDTARYPGLLAFLAAGKGQFASAAEVQSYLWSAHQSGQPGLATGISAFPSMHVSMICITALFINRYSRRLGLIAFVYVGVIVCSSVLLGWHYAVDGYAAIILTVLIYRGAEWLAKVLQSQRVFGSNAAVGASSAMAIGS